MLWVDVFHLVIERGSEHDNSRADEEGHPPMARKLKVAEQLHVGTKTCLAHMVFGNTEPVKSTILLTDKH